MALIVAMFLVIYGIVTSQSVYCIVGISAGVGVFLILQFFFWYLQMRRIVTRLIAKRKRERNAAIRAATGNLTDAEKRRLGKQPKRKREWWEPYVYKIVLYIVRRL